MRRRVQASERRGMKKRRGGRRDGDAGWRGCSADGGPRRWSSGWAPAEKGSRAHGSGPRRARANTGTGCTPLWRVETQALLFHSAGRVPGTGGERRRGRQDARQSDRATERRGRRRRRRHPFDLALNRSNCDYALRPKGPELGNASVAESPAAHLFPCSPGVAAAALHRLAAPDWARARTAAPSSRRRGAPEFAPGRASSVERRASSSSSQSRALRAAPMTSGTSLPALPALAPPPRMLTPASRARAAEGRRGRLAGPVRARPAPALSANRQLQGRLASRAAVYFGPSR